MSKLEFRKAERANAPLKLALVGPASSGKTYTALLLASRLRDEPKVAVLDSESGRSEKYSDLVPFDWVKLDGTFSPNRYIEVIQQAEAAGYNILIIDSLSHAWSGPGGVLDIQDRLNSGDLKLGSSSKGDNWGNWRHSKAFWRKLMDVILSSRMDIILCVRAKTEWEDYMDGEKKKKRKVGFKPDAEDNLDYEVDLMFNLERSHSASATKDTTRLYDDHMGGVLTAEDGAKLNEWRKSAPADWMPPAPKPEDDGEAAPPPKQAPAKTKPAAKTAAKKPAAKTAAPVAPAQATERTLQYILKVEKNPEGKPWTAVTTETHYLFMRDQSGTVDEGILTINADIIPSLKEDKSPKQMECFDGKIRPVAELTAWTKFDVPELEGPVTDNPEEKETDAQ